MFRMCRKHVPNLPVIRAERERQFPELEQKAGQASCLRFIRVDSRPFVVATCDLFPASH